MNDHEYIQWAVRTVQKMQAYLYVLYATETASLKHATQMIFDWDGKESYANKRDWEVHIGVTGVAIRYRVFINEDETALIERVKFTIRHEICHLKYTAGKSYSWGVEAGSRAVYEYIASSLGIARRFRSSSDVEAFKQTLYSKGIYIADEAIYSIISGIANSLCDGRIERIERSKDEGFKKDCIICRGENWKAGKQDFPEYSETEDNASLRLTIILQQILSLAKFQAYQNGFTIAYAGTPLMDQVNDLMPEISEGYLARSTKGMAEACRKISCKLAPLIFDAVKMATADAEVMKQLEELIRSILSSIANSANYGLVDTNAEDDDTDPYDSPSSLPFSNLVVTLPDEEYDRLMQKAKEGKDRNSGIQIRREHPKEEEQDNSGSEIMENSSAGSESDKDNKDSAGSNSGDPEANSGASSGSVENYSESKETECTQAVQKTPQKFSGTPEEDALLKAMEEAANSVGANISSMIDSVNQMAVAQSNTLSKKRECTRTQPLDPEDVKDICNKFRELRRTYKLDIDLPADLKARADVLRRETERYFERLREPNQRLKRNGMLDGKQLARLARNDTRVFMKKGKSKKADCCYYILLDNSGSTGGKHGRKRIAECRAAAIQEEAYKNIFPMKIVAFDADGQGVIHEVIKDWDERLHQNCCINFGVHGRGGYGNEDNFDIAIAARELLERPERKKMLIVLSDGAPGDVEATKQAISNARKKGIKVIGIYFEEGPVRYADDFLYMYETDCIACEMTEIESSLSEVIRDFAHN
ncbi:MAG: hypothetical protein IKS32_11825 [Solobacterium sp.]|nr:hypothetical protein [Solobacterium sp.]